MTREEERRLRLAACDLTPGRFAGRAELRREAERNIIALAQLELRLGLGTEEGLQEAIVESSLNMIRHYGVEGTATTAAGVLGLAYRHNRRSSRPVPERVLHSLELIAGVRGLKERRRTQKRAPDPIYSPKVAALIRARAGAAYDAAGFREARHSHRVRIEVVRPGKDGASSTSDRISSAAAGMSRAYQKSAYSVATSAHRIAVSIDLLSAPRSESGTMYLTPFLRVRQGVGTSLKLEQLEAGGRTLKWRKKAT